MLSIYIRREPSLKKMGGDPHCSKFTNSTKSIRSETESIEELKISKRKQSDARQRTLRIVKLQGIYSEMPN